MHGLKGPCMGSFECTIIDHDIFPRIGSYSECKVAMGDFFMKTLLKDISALELGLCTLCVINSWLIHRCVYVSDASLALNCTKHSFQSESTLLQRLCLKVKCCIAT